jgi:hypothetical protein
MIKDNDSSFTIKVADPTMPEPWYGEFRTLKRLTHRQILLRDKLRREYLGTNHQEAPDSEQNRAYILAHLAVSVVKAPTWWAESNQGLDLVGDAVIMELWRQVTKIQDETIKEDQNRLNENLVVLKEVVNQG